MANVRQMIQNTLALLHTRSRAYRLTFGTHNAHANVVLHDLAKFCHWGASPFQAGQRETDVMIGRQQVLLRIKQHLHMTDEQLFAVFNSSPYPQPNTYQEEDHE